jgi:hypothetical protein
MAYFIGTKELVPADSEIIAVLDVAIGIDAAKLTPAAGEYAGVHAYAARLNVQSGTIRWKHDGTSPVPLTDGELINDGDIIVAEGATALDNLLMVREDGAESPVAMVTLYWPGPKLQ